MQGNYLSWNAGWTLQKVTSYEASLADLCKDEHNMIYWFPSFSFEESQHMCPALASHHPSATDKKEIDTLFQRVEVKFSANHSCYKDFWTNITNHQEEGVWRDDNTCVYNHIIWRAEEPNGEVYENCACVANRDGVDDKACIANYHCVACLFDGSRRFSLLGTCELELQNMYFMLVQPDVGELEFFGYGVYKIRRREEAWVWLDSD